MDRPKYRIEIFWSDGDGGYIANVPVLRYCSAFGESYEEALHEVLVAMKLHLDTLRELDRPIPEPASPAVSGGSAPSSDFFTSFYSYLDQLAHDPAMMEDMVEQAQKQHEASQKLSQEFIEGYQDFLNSAIDQYRSSQEQSQKGTRNS